MEFDVGKQFGFEGGVVVYVEDYEVVVGVGVGVGNQCVFDFVVVYG